MCGLPLAFIKDAQAIKAHIIARAVDPARPLTSLRRLNVEGSGAVSSPVNDKQLHCRDKYVQMLRVSADLATRLAPLFIEVQIQTQVCNKGSRVAEYL